MDVIVMPKLGLTMKEGKINKWLKKVGEEVRAGDPLLEIETDKVEMVIESAASGLLRQVLAEEGQTVPIMEPIALIGTADEPLPDPDTLRRQAAPIRPAFETPVRHMYAPAPPAEAAAPPSRRAPEVRVSPVARRMAAEHGIDLSTIVGTGPEGRVVREDVERLIGAPEAEAGVEGLEVARTIPLSGVRKLIAERMASSARTAPHITISREFDMTEAVELQQRLANTGVKLSLTEVLVKAVALSLNGHPTLNSSLVGDEIRIWRNINIGVAVALEDGLIVPVIRDADRKSLREISQELRGLTEKAGDHKLSLQDVEGGTFTITNLGLMGIDFFTPIINPPQVAILGVGRLAQRPVVKNGEIAVRPTMYLSLPLDHRVIDGAVGAQFLATLQEVLRSPDQLST